MKSQVKTYENKEKWGTLCDGPDDDHLIGRNVLSMWYLYDN